MEMPNQTNPNMSPMSGPSGKNPGSVLWIIVVIIVLGIIVYAVSAKKGGYSNQSQNSPSTQGGTDMSGSQQNGTATGVEPEEQSIDQELNDLNFDDLGDGV